MLFKYKGIDQKGNNVSSKIEAIDIDEARRKLKVQNILIIKISKDQSLFSTTGKFSFFKRMRVISAKELATISRDLAIYLQAGVSIVNALKLLSNQYTHDKKIYLFFKTVQTYLDEGKNLYQALDTQSVIKLPEFYKQSIKVSENSGILDEILLELSKFLKNQDRLNKKLSNAFAYPMFIMVVAVFIVAFMMSVVVPKITTIFAQINQELPPISQFTIGVSNFVSGNIISIMAVLFIGVSAFVSSYSLNRRFKYMVDLALLKTPFFGSLIESSELARFSYMISVLMRSGVSFVQGINLAAKIVNNAVVQDVFLEAATKVVEGSKLSKVLNGASYKLNPSFVQAIALGEETSELTQILHNLSTLYEEESGDKIEVFLSLLEPFLMLLVGGLVGFIIVSMLLPVFSMNIG